MMINHILKLLHTLKEFKIKLQNFILECNSFYFKMNDQFEGEISENGDISLYTSLNLNLKENCKINIDKHLEIDGYIITNHILLKDKKQNLYNIEINDGKIEAMLI